MKTLLSQNKKTLMGLAALFILIYHTYAKFLMCIFVLGEVEGYVSRILFFGVDIFFMLSGLGIAYSLSRNSILRFYFNRLKRILPPVIIVCIIMALIDKWPLDTFINRVTGKFVFEDVYSFIWFYPAIVIFYLISPVLYKLAKLFKNKYVCALLFLIIYIVGAKLLYNAYGSEIEQWYGICNRLPIFFFGICIGSDENDKAFEFTKPKLLFVLLLLITGGVLAWYTSIKEIQILIPSSNCFFPNICLAISISMLTGYLIGISKDCAIKEKIVKFLNFFGAISFELYIVQEWICKKLTMVYEPVGRHKAVIFNVVCFSLVTLAAYILHFITNIREKVKNRNKE